jgi:poly(A) polymerase
LNHGYLPDHATYKRAICGGVPAFMIRRMLRRVFGAKRPARQPAEPVRVPAAEHGLRPDRISPCALKITETLHQTGYKAYVVGGAVRDLLLGSQPKDFDVATDATPEEVRRLFRRSRIIGRRFQIVHVMCGRDTVEVTTFRAAGVPEGEAEERPMDQDGRLLSDNVFGAQHEDAARRDFTANALYYDPGTEEILDYHGGVADIEARVLRMIGDPAKRYREDPVRMLRAARFAAKLDFRIDPSTRAPVAELAPLLANVPSARLFDEALKLLMSGHALRGVHQLRAEGLHHGLLPLLDVILDDPEGSRFIEAALSNTDERVRKGQTASPAFLFATLLWPEVQRVAKHQEGKGQRPIPALHDAIQQVLELQRERLAIPRRLDGMIKEIWSLQPRFEQRAGQRPFRLLAHERFRAGYDFLVLRAKGGNAPQELAQWWTRFQEAEEEERAGMLLKEEAPKRRRRRRGSRQAAAAPEVAAQVEGAPS